MNLFGELTRPYRAHPAKVVIDVPDGDAWTFARLDDLIGRMASVLQARGVATGDRVVAQVHKSPEGLALYLACLRSGAVFVPLNTAYTDREVRGFLEDADPAVIVLDPARHVDSDPKVLTLGGAGSGSLLDLAATAESSEAVDRSPDDPAAMLYTSGTTGRSKGAVLTHQNLFSNAQMLVDTWRFTSDDVLLHMLPVFHVHGLFVAVHCAMLSGASMLFHPTFDIGTVIDALPHCTVMMGVPTHYTRLLADDRFDRDRCRGVRLFTSGSAPLTAQTHAAVFERTGHAIIERYGMTEAGMITSNPYDGPREAGTVGFPLPGVEIRIVGDRGEPRPPGTPGVVETRGPHVFAEYRGMPDKTAEAKSSDGWLRTGDIGSVDEEGRLSLIGRQSDMIISGGLNVYPRDIEIVLDRVPGVAESAVVGLPHPDLGEAVVAFVVASGEFDDAAAAEALSDIARFKHPRQYVLVDELPRNAMGKVQKAQLRTEHAALFE